MKNDYQQWIGFDGELWRNTIDVQDFIKNNYKLYVGDESFLVEPTFKTRKVLKKLNSLQQLEREFDGVLDINTKTVSSLTSYEPGYLDKENELIVGLQTDRPLKRGINPFGGIRMANQACEAYGYKMSPMVEEQFTFRTTHNEGVFRVYTDEMKTARRIGIVTGLPDSYGRGRIIGDYRRVALYGVDTLIKEKERDKRIYGRKAMTEDNIRLCEELFKQISFLGKLKEMAAMYGIDISQPANNTKEAIQWLYFAYLAAIKEQNGAAMSLGRVSNFIDIYIERDFKKGILDESSAQELIDQFVIKLRCARHLRTPEYNELFGGDPMWITECEGGVTTEGKPMVTKTSYRFLHTLFNLKPSAEPNLTILWSKDLPESFKKYCAKVSIATDSIQYENDDLMRKDYGDDYAIACCVSAMKIGKQMQFFGARCNLPKLLLIALNGGKDENTDIEIGPQMPNYFEEYTDSEYLDFDRVMARFNAYQDWLCKLYVNTMNVIHYMHDKYAYEKVQMALHDSHVERFMAFGAAGLSILADSLSAIKYAKVKGIRDDRGLVTDFEIEGDFPKYGNDDDRVDSLAVEVVENLYNDLKKNKTYKDATHTLSILTITSNVVYGKKTGATPDGRKKGQAFAPGANPMHNRDENGALASLNSVAKLPYSCCKDGISNTFSIVPNALGKSLNEQAENLVGVLDGYFAQNSHHLNVNVLDREKLLAAYENPDEYPNLTIRVSGYAVNFVKLSREQQREVIARTFHTAL